MNIEKDCKYCSKVLACKGYDKSKCLIQNQEDFELDAELFEKFTRKDEKNKIISIIKEAKINYDVNNQNISTNKVVIFQFFNLLMEQELDKIIELIEKGQ